MPKPTCKEIARRREPAPPPAAVLALARRIAAAGPLPLHQLSAVEYDASLCDAFEWAGRKCWLTGDAELLLAVHGRK